MGDQDGANQSVGEITTQLEETSMQAPEEGSGLDAMNESTPQQATKVQDTSLVEVRSAGDLGKGVFAVHDIARGTRIISEAPLVVVKPSLRPETAEKHVTEFCGAVRALSAEDVKTLDDLYFYQIQVDETMQRVIYEWLEQHGDKQGRKLNTRNLRRTTSRTMTQLSIFVINGMRMDGDASDGDGLFALYSRINHSCSPNVAKSYNPTIKRLTVHAIRDIKAGDQLFTDYVNGTLHPKTWRQTVLLDNWRFICQCRACTETEEAKLRGQMMKMVDRLILYENPESQRTGLEGSEGPPQTLQQALEAYEEIAALLRHPAVDLQSIALCKIYRHCAKLSLKIDDIQKAREYARRELEVEETIIGTETEHLRDNLVGAKYWLEHLEEVVSIGDVAISLEDCEVFSLVE